MRVLITGHLGFIGSYLTKALKGTGIEWVGYDIVDGNDIRNKLRLEKFIEAGNYDLVIHMAALAGVRRGEEFPDEYISTNVLGTKNIVDLCEKYSCKLIFFSSSSVLGGNWKDYDGGLVEGAPYNPKSLYAITKVAGEQLVNNMKQQHFVIRPFTVYGENGRSDMVIYKWINQIRKNLPITFYGDGFTSRGYTYVKDLVEAIVNLLKLIDKGFTESRTIHLGGSEKILLKDVLEIFKHACRMKGIQFEIKELPMPDADVTDSYAETLMAKQILGFEPKPRFQKILFEILDNEL